MSQKDSRGDNRKYGGTSNDNNGQNIITRRKKPIIPDARPVPKRK